MAVDVVTAAQNEYDSWQASKKSAADRATVSTDTGVDGNSVTNSVSNDTLSNNDFLKLMLEEMKQQDPTKPMDSAALMDSQLKMSTIQSNQDMAAAMTALQTSYSNSALSTAANMIGHSVKTGELDDKGEDKIYKIVTVDNKDGELYVKAQQFQGIRDDIKNSETDKALSYDDNGLIYEDNATTEYRVSLDANGRIEYNDDGTLKLLNTDNEVVTDESITSKYVADGYSFLYSSEAIEIPLSGITTVS